MSKVVYKTGINFAGFVSEITALLSADIVSSTPTSITLNANGYSMTVGGSGLGFKPGKGFTGVVNTISIDFVGGSVPVPVIVVSQLEIDLSRIMASNNDPEVLSV